MSNTPTSLKVVGILGIIYASIALLSAPCGIIQTIHPFSSSPMTDSLNHDAVYIGYAIGAGTLGVGLAILLLASSIGCLKLKPWARMGMNTYAITHVLASAVGAVFTIVYTLPRMHAALATMPAGAAVPNAGMLNAIMIASLLFGLLITMGVALTILIICNRKIAVDAFHGILPADPANFPVDYPPPPGL